MPCDCPESHHFSLECTLDDIRALESIRFPHFWGEGEGGRHDKRKGGMYGSGLEVGRCVDVGMGGKGGGIVWIVTGIGAGPMLQHSRVLFVVPGFFAYHAGLPRQGPKERSHVVDDL